MGRWQVNESSLTKEWSLKVGNKYDHSRLSKANGPDITKTPHQIPALLLQDNVDCSADDMRLLSF